MVNFFAWLVLLGAAAIFAEQSLNLDPAHIPSLVRALPASQQLAIVIIALMVLSLMVSAVWQSRRLARQNDYLKSLHARIGGARQGIASAGEAQKDLDAAVHHLAESDPEETIARLQEQLAGIEQRAAHQKGRSQAVDMQQRLDDVRHRQQALREQVGEIAEKRRLIEPVFSELKDRQRQIERQLDKIETDDNSNNLADRMRELDQSITAIHTRQKALEDSFVTLGRYKEDMEKSKSDLVPLQAAQTGIRAIIPELHTRRDELIKAIEEIETSGDEKLSSRVEALTGAKRDIEQRIVRLDASYLILDTVRRDLQELKARRDNLEQSFAQLERDSDGRSLDDRLEELSAFSAQTHARLRSLQEALATLSRLRKDVARSQTELAPLQAPDEGIGALISELDIRGAQLAKALDELEFSGDEKLGSRVDGLANSKRETEQRIAQVYEYFAKLDTIRNDIAVTFTTISNTLGKLS